MQLLKVQSTTPTAPTSACLSDEVSQNMESRSGEPEPLCLIDVEPSGAKTAGPMTRALTKVMSVIIDVLTVESAIRTASFRYSRFPAKE